MYMQYVNITANKVYKIVPVLCSARLLFLWPRTFWRTVLRVCI